MPDTGASTKPLLASGKDNEGSLETDSAIREPSNPGRTATDLHRTISHFAAWAGSCTAVDAVAVRVASRRAPTVRTRPAVYLADGQYILEA